MAEPLYEALRPVEPSELPVPAEVPRLTLLEGGASLGELERPQSAFGQSTPLNFVGGNAFNQPSDYLERLRKEVEAQHAAKLAVAAAERNALLEAQKTPEHVRQLIAQQAAEAARRHTRQESTGWLRLRGFFHLSPTS